MGSSLTGITDALEGVLEIQGHWPKKIKGIRDIFVNT